MTKTNQTTDDTLTTLFKNMLSDVLSKMDLTELLRPHAEGAVTGVMSDIDFEDDAKSAVEDVINDYDFTDAVDAAVDQVSFEDKAEEAVNEAINDLDIEVMVIDKVNEVVDIYNPQFKDTLDKQIKAHLTAGVFVERVAELVTQNLDGYFQNLVCKAVAGMFNPDVLIKMLAVIPASSPSAPSTENK